MTGRARRSGRTSSYAPVPSGSVLLPIPYDTLSFSGEVTDETDGMLTIEVVGRVVTARSTT